MIRKQDSLITILLGLPVQSNGYVRFFNKKGKQIALINSLDLTGIKTELYKKKVQLKGYYGAKENIKWLDNKVLIGDIKFLD